MTFHFFNPSFQAKEFFGDPLESRQVEIQGLEGFNQDTTVSFKRFTLSDQFLNQIAFN